MSQLGQSRHFDRAPMTSGLPHKQTFSGSVVMSHTCQSQTFTREPDQTGIAHHIDGKNCGKATLFSSAGNVRQGIGKSQPSPRASERPPQQDHGGHHDRAHQPNRMRPTARAPIIYNARDDHKLKDQTWD